MKKVLLYFLILLPVISFSQITSGELTYRVSYLEEKDKQGIEQFNSKNPGLIPKERLEQALKDVLEANKSLAYIDYVLEFNKNEAYFQVKQNFMSIGSEIGKENFINFYVGVSGEYYHNIEKNISIHSWYHLDRQWLIEDELYDFKWKLLPETKIIQGYTCYKAIHKTKRPIQTYDEVIAWYAPGIPFSFGPAEYEGLPGLILELEQGVYRFSAENIKFSEKPKKIKIPTKGEKHNREDFDKKQEQIMNRLKGQARK